MRQLAEKACVLVFALLVAALTLVFAVNSNLIDQEGRLGRLVIALLTDYKAVTYGIFILLVAANAVCMALARRKGPADESEAAD